MATGRPARRVAGHRVVRWLSHHAGADPGHRFRCGVGLARAGDDPDGGDVLMARFALIPSGDTPSARRHPHSEAAVTDAVQRALHTALAHANPSADALVRPASPAQLHDHPVAVGGVEGVEAAGPVGHGAIVAGGRVRHAKGKAAGSKQDTSCYLSPGFGRAGSNPLRLRVIRGP